MPSTLIVELRRNVLDQKTWTTHQVDSLSDFLFETFGNSFPSTGKIYHNQVDAQHEVTPATPAGVQYLLGLKGKLFILVNPAGGVVEATIAINAALFVFSNVISHLFSDDKKDPGRPPRSGSPNNALSNRQNRSRLLGRIPDNFGSVRATPDLVAQPYTTYDSNHREVEICQMCLGRGEYEVNTFLVFEGDAKAQNTQGLSVEIYDPGVLPTIGSPVTSIGAAINEPVRTVYKLESVNGQVLLPFNAKTMHGAELTDPDSIDETSGLPYAAIAFRNDGAGIGRISVPYGMSAAYRTAHGSPEEADPAIVTDRVAVGDVLECRFDPEGITMNQGGHFKNRGQNIMNWNGLVGAIGTWPNLADNNLGYEVLSLTTFDFGSVAYVDIEVAIPPALQTQWDQIDVTQPGGGGFYCVSVLLTPKYRGSDGAYDRQVGSFFIDDPNMEQIYCNFVAERGLFMDDGKNIVALKVDITVMVAPADASGVATGAFEEHQFTVVGSQTDLSTRALTAVITPSFSGRCLIACVNDTAGYWRVDDPGQGRLSFDTAGALAGHIERGALIPAGGAYPASEYNPAANRPYQARKGTVQDQIRWTHCYSMSDPQVSAFGNTTLVMTKTVASKAANVRNDRKLSMIALRQHQTWNGSTFGGANVSTDFAEDVFFAICKDPVLGNMTNAQIDFVGIAAAFQAARAYFGDNVVRFSHTFDSESTTLEDMLQQVAQSCFCVAYREGNVIKVKPDIASEATMLFNHRNMLPGSEQRTTTFGTEADYDGVKVDYFDDSSNTIKSLTVPSTGAQRPREISIAGLRSYTRAAIHAWRAYNRILYQNTVVEFEALMEAGKVIYNDKVLIADGTRPETQAGEVLEVTGGTLLKTSQLVETRPGTMTAFLQLPDGTVEGITCTVPDSHHILLAGPPSVALIDDPVTGVRALYELVASTETRSKGFLIQTKNQLSRMTWQLSAINYSHGYYFVDGLHLWINPRVHGTVQDESPYQRLSVATGGTVTSDPTRGTIYDANGGEQIDITVPAGGVSITGYTSYTKAAWVYKNVTGDAVEIISFQGVAANEEKFLISTGDDIRVFHGGSAIVTWPGFPIAEWVHVACTFDGGTGLASIYLQGEIVTFASGQPGPGARSGLRVMDGLNGMADDIRLYFRVLSAEEIRELYQKTRMT